MNYNSEESRNFWENTFFDAEEFASGLSDLRSFLGEPIAGMYYDSSSPDGAQSSTSKNIVSERNRRKKLNDRLYALRAVVPNITKMDKASIIKDAIEYIQTLHEEERRIQAEILELENGRSVNSGIFEYDSRPKRSRLMDYNCCDSAGSRSGLPFSPIEVLELRVSNMGGKKLVVSLACSKRTDTMVKLCEIFESLNLKIITANITAFPGRLMKTVFLEAEEDEKEELRLKIETAIAALNDPDSPMST